MPKFRKKPVVVEAVQFTGPLTEEIEAFFGVQKWWVEHENATEKSIIIRTLEGDMTCSQGDWIIRGVKGEFYPCKPDIFEATYEPVQEG